MNPNTQRLAVSSLDDTGMDAKVSAHFGRCAAFTLVELEDGKVQKHEVVANPFAAQHGPGQVPAFLSEIGANVVLSGGMGFRAIEFFGQYGVQASTGHGGTVREAVAAYVASGPLDSGGCSGHGLGGCEEHE